MIAMITFHSQPKNAGREVKVSKTDHKNLDILDTLSIRPDVSEAASTADHIADG